MEEVYQFLLHNLNLTYRDSVVVAVSGGPDSMALLHLLTRLERALEITVVVAHVNHNVRKESVSERLFVERYCKNHHLLFETMEIEEYGEENFHQEARGKRYAYFERLVREYHAKYLFTAHHGDDLMETILMRLVRGSTLRGYSGFSKVVFKEGYQIIRPLIEVTKEEILQYNKKHHLSFVTDASNEKDVYTRNRFRKYIVAPLKKEEPMVHKKFYKFSETLLECNEYVEKQVKSIYPTVYYQNCLHIKPFLKLDLLLQKRILTMVLESIYQDDLFSITDHHVALLYDVICSSRPNVSLYLPNRMKAVKSYQTLSFVLGVSKHREYDVEFSQFLNLPNGKNIEKVSALKKSSNNAIRLMSSEMTLPLMVRTRHNGDKMSVKGMLGSKKVSDILIDSKIPMEQRELWPVVTDAKGTILWIPGLKKSKFDKTNEEKYDIILKYY